MKREDLKAISGVTDEMIDAIMNLHGKDVEAWKTEKQSLIDSSKELSDKVKEFEGVDVADLQKQIADWKTKYDADMTAKDKDFAMSKLLESYEFSSSYARAAIEAEFKEKDLKFEGGKFLGADDFFKQAKEKDPNAFKSEQKPDTKPNDSGVGLGGSKNPPKMSGVESVFYSLNPDLKPKA